MMNTKNSKTDTVRNQQPFINTIAIQDPIIIPMNFDFSL